ncbi:acyltransferase [Fibrella sp. USSR17]
MGTLARFVLSPINSVSLFTDKLLNKLMLHHSKVDYVTFPVIDGRIVVRNRGYLKIGKNVKFNCSLKSNFVGLHKTCTIYVAPKAHLEIGDYSGLSGVSIHCSQKIVIGKYVNVGGNVSVWDSDFHPLDFRARRLDDETTIKSASIHIGDDAFIGANSIILKGVTIGERSIVGAGSVVTRSIPANEIWAGNPAKFIRAVDRSAIYHDAMTVH